MEEVEEEMMSHGEIILLVVEVIVGKEVEVEIGKRMEIEMIMEEREEKIEVGVKEMIEEKKEIEERIEVEIEMKIGIWKRIEMRIDIEVILVEVIV